MADPIELLESFPRSLSGGAPTPDQLRKRGDQRRKRHRAAGAVAVMAVLAAVVTPLALNADTDGTAPAPATPTEVVSLSGNIPEQFPLMTGLPLWTSSNYTTPEDAKETLALQACGRSPQQSPQLVDSLELVAHSDGGTYQRTVSTFQDHDAAAAWAGSVRKLFEDCPDETVDGPARHEVTVGSAPSDPFISVTEVGGRGVQVDQVYVVGRAVLLTQAQTDQADAADVQEFSAAQTGFAKPVVAALGHEWTGFHGQYGGVFIEDAAEVPTKLEGASADFQSFVSGLVNDLNGQADCPDAAVGVTVDYIVDDRWALGGVNQCGGYVALWGKTDGSWKELEGTQDLWSCSDLTDLGIPEGIVGPCYDYGGE